MEKIDSIFANLKKREIISISTDDFYAEVRDLTGDLIFLKELTSRMKKSRFDFVCIPTINGNINGMFIKKIWNNAICGGWSINEDTVNLLLKIYYILNGLFKSLDNGFYLNNEDCLMINDLDKILSEEFSMTLCDEVNHFIGCSSSCRFVKKRLVEIGLK